MSIEFSPTKLGTLIEFSNGRTSPERSENGRWPVFGSNGTIGVANETNSVEETLVIGRVGSYCGSVYFSPTRCWVTDNAIRGVAKEGNSPKFLFYLLKHLNLNNWRSGSGQPLINQSILNSIDVRVPGPIAQQEIGRFLSSLDDRIALLRETNATLEAIAQALFKSWFVDFDPVRAKQAGLAPQGMDEATAALFPDRLTESPLGWVPRGWRVGSLSDLCSISSGKRPPDRSDELTAECDVPLYGGAGLMGFTSASLFDAPRIVTGRVGTLGKVHVAYPPFWASDNVLVLTPEDNSMFAFSVHWLRSIDVHALNRGSTQPLLTQRDLGAQLGVIPSPEVLAEFEAVVSPIYQQIRDHGEQAQTLATLRDTLLPRLISGQLQLPEADV